MTHLQSTHVFQLFLANSVETAEFVRSWLTCSVSSWPQDDYQRQTSTQEGNVTPLPDAPPTFHMPLKSESVLHNSELKHFSWSPKKNLIPSINKIVVSQNLEGVGIKYNSHFTTLCSI